MGFPDAPEKYNRRRGNGNGEGVINFDSGECIMCDGFRILKEE